MSVERFLGTQPHALSRAGLGARASDFFEDQKPTRHGAAWRALTAELGLHCSDALVQLGDAMAEQFIYLRFRGHQYAMLTPDGARSARERIVELANSWWAGLKPLTVMVPVFSEDGDHLMLDAAGAFWDFRHDFDPPRAPVVMSLELLLEEATPPAINL